ncbi:U32 family peptidase [Candidatus Poribacteria bacterium]|nr:U32 family peptidase [Candidatus Poribacteria bacterium]
MLELVVPTPDYNSALIAIKAGADSIYAPIEGMVNLRFKAPFFNLTSLKKIVRKAHQKEKKVYAVLNKCVNEKEFPVFAKMLEELAVLRVDAVVLGDIGLIKWTNEHFKKHTFKIIGSSVIGHMNLTDIKFLIRIGVDRIIVPRLITGESLTEIASSNTEVEIYVHGNLCPSWDGINCKLINLYDPEKKGICANKNITISKDHSRQNIMNFKIESGTLSAVSSNIPISPCLNQFHVNNNIENFILWDYMIQCDIGLIPIFNRIGITSIKVIPANSSPVYIKKVINIWREALDSYYYNPDEWTVKDKWIQTLQTLHHSPLRMDMYYLGKNF